MSRIYILFCIVIFALIVVTSDNQTQAQESHYEWSIPIRLDETSEFDMDPALFYLDGRLHIFWNYGPGTFSENRGRTIAVYHRYLDMQGNRSWSPPIDVLAVPASDSLLVPQIALSTKGVFHILWFGNNQQIFYSQAVASEAHSAWAWSPARPIATSRGSGAFRFDIVTDTEGDLHVLYADEVAGQVDLFYIESTDKGSVWTPPVRLSTTKAGLIVAYPRLAIDGQRRLHAVWGEYPLPDGWPPAGVRYTRSEDNGHTWTEPRLVAGEMNDLITLKAVGDNEIHLVWHKTGEVDPAGRGRYHQWSSDGGCTWSEPKMILEGISGRTGWADMAVDSAGTLHLIVAGTNRYNIPSDEYDKLYYSYWNGAAWSTPVLIAGDINASEPSIVVTEGNHLHVAFSNLSGEVWYLTKRTMSPYEPVLSTPIRSSMATEMATATSAQSSPTAIPKSTPMSTVVVAICDSLGPQAVPQNSAWSPIVMGTLSALVVIAAVFIGRQARR